MEAKCLDDLRKDKFTVSVSHFEIQKFTIKIHNKI